MSQLVSRARFVGVVNPLGAITGFIMVIRPSESQGFPSFDF